jgi:hypothetical protein
VWRRLWYGHSVVVRSGATGCGVRGLWGDEAVATEGEAGQEHGVGGGLSQPTARIIGVLEVLEAIGIVLPALTGIVPWLTPLAALGLVLTMIGAALRTCGVASTR